MQDAEEVLAWMRKMQDPLAIRCYREKVRIMPLCLLLANFFLSLLLACLWIRVSIDLDAIAYLL